jgi:methyl-accepting chemotaxis protein
MKKRSNGREGIRAHPEPTPSHLPTQTGAERLGGGANPARPAARGARSLVKTSELATSVLPRPSAAGPQPSPPRAPLPGRTAIPNPRTSRGPTVASAAREQKIDERIAAATEEMASGITEAASAAEELRRAMEQIAAGAEQAASASQQTAAAANSTAATLLQARQRAESGRGRSERLQSLLADTASQVGSWASNIRHGGERQAASIAIVEQLSTQAESIGEVTRTVSHVSDETNLLALNAAIEAARAGEHGLGFAVVADEVRKLAEKSTQSTKEIADLIQSIQREARQAVENMERSTRIVEEGLTLGNDLGSALHKISNVVTEVYKFSQEIGAATNEQSVGSSQIAKATSRLTEITQEINSAVEEQASGAQAVVRAMDKMRELVQQSASSSTELSAAAEQMLKLSRNLLDSMDKFVLDRATQQRSRRSDSSFAKRRGQESGRDQEPEYAEMARS